jgi:hypothetical protein
MAKKQTADRAASASPKSAARRKGRQGSPAAPQTPLPTPLQQSASASKRKTKDRPLRRGRSW